VDPVKWEFREPYWEEARLGHKSSNLWSVSLSSCSSYFKSLTSILRILVVHLMEPYFEAQKILHSLPFFLSSTFPSFSFIFQIYILLFVQMTSKPIQLLLCQISVYVIWF
jgi:hypothetical protein